MKSFVPPGLALLVTGVAACAGGPKTPQAAGTAQAAQPIHARCAAEVPGTTVALQRVGNAVEVAFRTSVPQHVDDLRAQAFRQGQGVRGRAAGGGLSGPVQPLPPVVVQPRTTPDGLVLTYWSRAPEDLEIVHTLLRDDVSRQNRGLCGMVRPASTGMGTVPPATASGWEADPVPEAPDREWKLSITVVEVSEPLARACRIPPERRFEVFDAADARMDGYPVLATLVRCLDKLGGDRPLRVLGRADPAESSDYEAIMGTSRAAALGAFLVKQGAKVEVVDHAGHQAQTPVDGNGWSWERRVDIE